MDVINIPQELSHLMGSKRYDHVIFLHIYKTAGSSFGDILAQTEKQDRASTKLVRSMAERNDIARLSTREMPKLSYIYGHCVQDLHSCLPGTTGYVTMLREPIDRFVSDYYFRISLRDGPASYNVRDKTLEQWIDTVPKFEPQIDLLTINWPGFKKNTDKLEFALRNLDEHFIFTGVTEYFTQSIILCCGLLGWSGIRPSTLTNKSPRRPSFGALPSQLIRKIEKIVEPDLELYDIIRKRFEKMMLDFDLDEMVWEFEKLKMSQIYDEQFVMNQQITALNQRVERATVKQELSDAEITATKNLLEVQNARIERLQSHNTHLLRQLLIGDNQTD